MYPMYRRQTHAFHLLTILLVLLPAALCAAQAETTEGSNGAAAQPPPVPEWLKTPGQTVTAFMAAMSGQDSGSEPDYDRAISCLQLSGLTREAEERLAEKLHSVIIRIEDVQYEAGNWQRRYLYPGSGDTFLFFPRNRSISHDTSRRQRELINNGVIDAEAKIRLIKTEAGAWLFSSETMDGIETLYDELADEPVVSQTYHDVRKFSIATWIEGRCPEWAKQKMLGVKTWQWIGLLVLIFIGMILDFSVRFWIRLISRRMIRRRGEEPDRESLKRTVRPFGLATTALFWLIVIGSLDLPAQAATVLMPAVRFFVMLAGVWALCRVTDLVGEVAAAKAEQTDTKFDDLLIPLLRKTMKTFIVVFGLIYIADSLNISIVPLLTGLGIGGVGFAFAAKDTLEHFFGSVTVIADRPFQVGDWVVINDTEGTVEEVGFRSTRVRTFYNSLVTIPNGNLVRAVVDNYGRRKYRRWKTHINLTYDTPPDKLEAFCEGLRELIRLHPYTRKDYYQIWLHQFGPHSLDVLVYVFWETPDWQTELRERHRLMMDTIRLADQIGVEFAFPTQTLHMYKEEYGAEHAPEEIPEKAADFRAMRSGRSAAREVTSNASWRERKPDPYRFRHASETEAEDDETQIESKIGGDG